MCLLWYLRPVVKRSSWLWHCHLRVEVGEGRPTIISSLSLRCWQDVSVFTVLAGQVIRVTRCVGYHCIQSLPGWPAHSKHSNRSANNEVRMSTCSEEPPYFPLRSRRASFPFSLAASSRTSLCSEGSKSVIVSYKCKQTTSSGIFGKKTKELYEGQFQR